MPELLTVPAKIVVPPRVVSKLAPETIDATPLTVIIPAFVTRPLTSSVPPLVTETVAPLGVLLDAHVLRHDVDGNHER